MISVLFFSIERWKQMDSEKVRSIRLPEYVWDALDEDAARCRRSSQKHLEALLLTFYDMQDVEINKQTLAMVGELLPHSKKKMPLLETQVENQKKKRSA
jgi:hypothetical protein